MNKVILKGNLVAMPELCFTPNNTAVCKFTVAVKRRFDKEKTDFLNCVAWKKTGEFVSSYFEKGQQIIVCGTVETRSWKDKEGTTRYATEVIADEVDFCGKGKENISVEPAEHTEVFVVADDNDLPF